MSAEWGQFCNNIAVKRIEVVSVTNVQKMKQKSDGGMRQTRLRDRNFYNIRLCNHKNTKIFLDRLIFKNNHRGNLWL